MLSLVIDTDTASDDAVALLFALHDVTATVRALTVVGGNVPLSQAVRNALGTLVVGGGHDVEVYAGCGTPLVRPLETAQNVHGIDGMGGVGLPARLRGVEAEHAVDALRRIATDEPGQHTLVTLGPLTNVAAAVTIDPTLLTRFQHTYLMAGAPDAFGNVSAVGEFNVWADPEAASIVFNSLGPKSLVGWNVSRLFTVIEPADAERLRSLGTMGNWICDVNVEVDRFCREVTNLPGYDLPDPVTMAIALDPSLVTDSAMARVDVVLDGQARGLTYVNHLLTAAAPNMRVVWAIDRARFLARLDAVAAWRV